MGREPMRVGIDELIELTEALKSAGVSRFEYQDSDYRLRLGFAGAARHPAAIGLPAASPAPRLATEEEAGVYLVTSPFVGTFYRALSPNSPPCVEVGESVAPGRALCIIEAMKLMNEIEADIAGVVVGVLVENGKSVEYGQPLFKMKRA